MLPDRIPESCSGLRYAACTCPVKGKCVALTQGSIRNLINMVTGLLGGPSTLLMNGGEKHNRSAFASTLENLSHVKRRASGSHCSSCYLFLTEHNSCSFP